MISIIDYDAGNIKSVEKALQYLGAEAVVTRDPETILSSDGVILPGVGAFGDAMGRLRSYGLEEVLQDVTKRRIPFLGICLGLQLLFEDSEESPGVKGLGILKGHIRRIPSDGGLKVPQIGWNSLSFPKKGTLFEGIPEAIAKTVTEKLDIPTIGIGAGRYCDGQVLVSDDLLGMFTDFTPKFVKKYANLAQIIQDATKQYSKEVKEGKFPQEVNTYK